MILDGLGYSVECINMTQFFYEEACQVAILAAGTAYIGKDYNLALNCIRGPTNFSIQGLWGFGVVYGSLIPATWMAFARYWMMMKHYSEDMEFKIERDSSTNKLASTDDKIRQTGNACMADIANSIATVKSEGMHWIDFRASTACTQWYEDLKRKKGLILADHFKRVLGNYFKTYSTSDKIELLRLFKTLYAEDENIRTAFYNGQPINVRLGMITKTEMRQTAKTIWNNFNILQKLAFRNLPGGSKLFGYDIFFKMLWEGNINQSKDIENTGYAFIQIGIGSPSVVKSEYLSKDKTKYKLADDPTLMDSWNYYKGNSDLDVTFLTDTQKGTVYCYKDTFGKIVASCIGGGKSIKSKIVATNPKEGQIFEIKDIPIRWGTLYLTETGTYPIQICVQPNYSLIEIRYPTTFKAGARIDYRTFKPLIGATMKIMDKTDTVIYHSEVTEKEGLFRFGLTKKHEPYNLHIFHQDYGTYTLNNMKMEQICSNGYINIEHMEGWEWSGP